MSESQLASMLDQAGFKLVYQSGHGNVYCNNDLHVWTGGGYTEVTPIDFRRIGKCDCEKWQNRGIN